MDCNDLCNVDDLAKTLTVDVCTKNINVRKIKKRQITFKSFVENEVHKCIEEFFNEGVIKKAVSDLIEIAKRYKLIYHFRIRNESWLAIFLKMYLNFLHPDSMVELKACDRFSNDRFNGVIVVAKKKIKANTSINYIFGVYKDINEDEELLNRHNLDFSILVTSSSSKSRLLLGTIAFINHNCNPNCEYASSKKNVATIKVIKDIEVGQELVVFYSKDYFGKNNEDCECSTCYNEKYYSLNKPSSSESEKNESFDSKLDKSFVKLHRMSLSDTNATNNLPDLVDKDFLEFSPVMNNDNKLIMKKGINLQRNTTLSSNISSDSKCFDDSLNKPSSSESEKDESFDSKLNKSFVKLHRMSLSDTNATNNLNDSLVKDFSKFSPEKACSMQQDDTELQEESTSLNSRSTVGVSKNDECFDTKLNKAFVKLYRILISDANSTNNLHESNEKNQTEDQPLKPFCMYCEKPQSQFAKHILQHKDQELVKHYIAEKDIKQRAKILSYIRNKGSGLLERKTGKIKPEKRTRKGIITLKVQCEMCKGRFSKETLWKHKKNCYGNHLK